MNRQTRDVEWQRAGEENGAEMVPAKAVSVEKTDKSILDDRNKVDTHLLGCYVYGIRCLSDR